MTALQLHGTPLSHFTRMLRILLAELGVAFDFVRLPGVLATGASAYADNPMQRVPIMIHGAVTMFEAEHIARYCVTRFDTRDWFSVRSEEVDDLNRMAVIRGIMANEVVLILAKRGGLADTENVVYFQKLVGAIEGSLAWLDERTQADTGGFDWRDIALVSMWQHINHYVLLPNLDRYANIAARVARFSTRPAVASTTPAASLAEAQAAGWKAG
ncbi:MAG TPA: glutathione S-transferase family protein [Kofleriaceae bacterium]|jgi:glutathione S-transferase